MLEYSVNRICKLASTSEATRVTTLTEALIVFDGPANGVEKINNEKTGYQDIVLGT